MHLIVPLYAAAENLIKTERSTSSNSSTYSMLLLPYLMLIEKRLETCCDVRVDMIGPLDNINLFRKVELH